MEIKPCKKCGIQPKDSIVLHNSSLNGGGIYLFSCISCPTCDRQVTGNFSSYECNSFDKITECLNKTITHWNSIN